MCLTVNTWKYLNKRVLFCFFKPVGAEVLIKLTQAMSGSTLMIGSADMFKHNVLQSCQNEDYLPLSR